MAVLTIHDITLCGRMSRTLPKIQRGSDRNPTFWEPTCTRPRGHDGNHQEWETTKSGGFHRLAEWGRDDA